MDNPVLRPRERDALIQALRAGVTPLLGARHIQVGRDAVFLATVEGAQTFYGLRL
jgi:hypothetical protein